MSKTNTSNDPCECSRPKCSDFGLTVEDPGVFARSQWSSRSRFVYLIYRVLFACYVVSAQTFCVFELFPLIRFKYLIFLSEWTVAVLTLYSLLSLFGALCNKPALMGYRGYEELSNIKGEAPPKPPRLQIKRTTPFIFKLAWILFDICLAWCPCITLVYWYMLYDTDREYSTVAEYKLFAIDIYEHAVTTLLVYLDLFVSATPIRVAHMIYGLFFGILYVGFSIIYWNLDGTTPWGSTALYSILDWDTPVKTAYYVAGSAGVIVVMHLLGYVLSKFRICIYNCFCAPKPPKLRKISERSKPANLQFKQAERPYHAYFVLTTSPTEGRSFEQAPLARVDSTDL